jgi:hypothetical protein
VQRIVILLSEAPQRGGVYDKIRTWRQHQPKLMTSSELPTKVAVEGGQSLLGCQMIH